MTRPTIDFGIDLGTTNSAIAVLRDVGTEIIKNNDDADITPSAVSIDRNGEVLIGLRAKAKSAEHPLDAYREFKRRMGTDFVYRFKQAKLDKRPEELSAEILKELKASVQQRTGENIDASVITIPAAFELPQCDATRRAAQLAGLGESPLLQEPVAAALAYGFQIDTQKAYWLVYDFGGGTFDAALIKSEEGTIRVVNHGGDNYLGGSDIDQAIVDKLVVPRIVAENDLEDFRYSNARWATAFALLRRAAEVAKLELSRKDKTETRMDDCGFDDGRGNRIEVDYKITREDVRRITEPFIRRSVGFCQQVLAEKNLSKTAVERVILVGGPTLAPYFRELLSEQLGMVLDHSVDPLTVVARGAAVYAGTQRRAVRPSSAATSQTFILEVKYNPVGVDPNPLIGGKVVSQSGASLSGLTIELVDRKTRWRSGKIPIAANGIFTTTLRAERGQRNVYTVELLDSTGRRHQTVPEVLTYTIGAAVSEQVLPHSLGIALSDNQFVRIFEKGQTLPAKESRKYGSDVSLKRGQADAKLFIPVCEGESSRADRNKLVGRLEILAANIPRDLPRGSDIEVTLRIDESRKVTVEAYVPVLDKDFRAVLQCGIVVRKADEIRSELSREEQRIQKLKVQAASAGDKDAARNLAQIEAGESLEEMQTLAREADDPGTAAKCEGRLLELKIKIDQAEDRLEWPRLAAETDAFIADFVTVVKEGGTPEQGVQAAAIVEDLRDLVKKQKRDDLKEKRSQADALYWRLVRAQPGFWMYMFQELEKKVEAMTDPERARRLLDQGRAFISHNNLDGLRNVVNSLWQMLPEEQGEELQRGYQSGIRLG